MEKIPLIVLGLTVSPASNNAYALILKEEDGNRRLPIIIGAYEAQAIALELEGVRPPRPMTHDLIKSIMDAFNIILVEVYINDLKDGTFYAKLIFDYNDTEIDVRPSDAIALAVRCNAPIFVNSDVLEETGILPSDNESLQDINQAFSTFSNQEKPKKNQTKLEQLQAMLDKAIKDEDYERAAILRDEIKKALGSS
jgi:bifunctional DNase/RNase